MRYALGLDVDDATSFAAVIGVESAAGSAGATGSLAVTDSARPRELSIASRAPEHDDSIVEATLAAISLATRREGEAPSGIVLAHPLAWDGRRAERLRRALAAAGVTDIRLLDSALAAAIGADAAHEVGHGHVVAVVALRGGGVEVRALRKDGASAFHAVGAVATAVGLSELELDATLLTLVEQHVAGGVPDADPSDPKLTAALEKLHLAVRVARERLCTDESTFVGVRLPGRATVVLVERSDFEDAVAASLRETIPALVRAIDAAVGSAGPVDEILITGSAAPSPLLARLLGVEFDVPVVVADARHGGSFGAARAAAVGVPALGVPSLGVPALVGPALVGPAPVMPVTALSNAAVTKAVAPTAAAPEPAAPKPVPTLVRQRTAPMSAATHVNASIPAIRPAPPVITRRRTPLTLLQLWPIGAATAVLLILGGAAATGLVMTPTGTEHPSGPGAPASVDSASSSSAPLRGTPRDATGKATVSGDTPSGGTKSGAKKTAGSGGAGSGGTGSGGAGSSGAANGSGSGGSSSSPSSDPSSPASDPGTPTSDPSTPTTEPSTPSSDPSTPTSDPSSPSDAPSPSDSDSGLIGGILGDVLGD